MQAQCFWLQPHVPKLPVVVTTSGMVLTPATIEVVANAFNIMTPLMKVAGLSGLGAVVLASGRVPRAGPAKAIKPTGRCH